MVPFQLTSVIHGYASGDEGFLVAAGQQRRTLQTSMVLPLHKKKNKLKLDISFLLRGAVCGHMEQRLKTQRCHAEWLSHDGGDSSASVSDLSASAKNLLLSSIEREESSASPVKCASPEVYPWMKELRSKGMKQN